MKPGSEEVFDLSAAARPLEARTHQLSLEHEERGKRLHRETLDEVGPLFLRDAIELEGLVISTPLQYLSEEPLDATAMTRDGRVEEDEP